MFACLGKGDLVALAVLVTSLTVLKAVKTCGLGGFTWNRSFCAE